tara:strand:+ start:538 stop:1890 length:1353 start_codon:yes stop_codon:yes gene_type:complete
MEKILRKILRVPLESPAPDPVFDPDLDLQFAKDLALDHRITFTRASTATFVGSNKLIQSASNNVARFDHDPATGESLGLLIEGQRTNLITRSESFSNWALQDSTLSTNATTAPDGTTNAVKLVENTDNDDHFINFNVSITSGATCTLSAFLKQAESNRHGYLRTNNEGTSTYIVVDLSNGTVSEAGSDVISSSVQDFGNGWYRASFTYTNAGDTGSGFIIGISNSTTPSDDSVPYTGDGSSGIFIFGAQFEEGAFPTSYIPTSGAAATRSADLCDILTNTFRFSETEGSILIETEAFNDAGATHIFYRFHGGNTDESITLLNKSNDTSQHRYQIRTGATQIVGKNVAKSILQVFRSIVTYKKDNFTFASQGESPTAATSGTPPTGMTELSIGKNHGTANLLNGHIRTLQYFARQLDDETILALSQPSLEPSLSLVFDSSETSFVDTELTR